MKYTVHVDDNFNFMDEEERYSSGSYDTLEAAVARCKQLIEEELQSYLDQGYAPDKLFETWAMWGEDPFIRPSNDSGFSARAYAKEFSGSLT